MPILKKAPGRTVISNIVKAVVFLGVLIFIYLKIQDNPFKFDQINEILNAIFNSKSILPVGILIALTPANWILEGLKWQLLVNRVEAISLSKSIRSVLIGLSMGFITPHALGDYAGRIWQLKVRNRAESLGAILLGRAAQYFATFTFGLVGVSYLLFHGDGFKMFFAISFCFVFLSLTIGCTLFLFFRRRFLQILDFGKLQRVKKYFKIVTQYSYKETTLLLVFSFLRYLIFATQFYILLFIFKISADPGLLIAGVTWTLFAKSSLPSFNFLSDLGVREFSALFFFSYYGVDNTLVLWASFTLWCLNLLVPAVFGLAGVLRMKIFTTP